MLVLQTLIVSFLPTCVGQYEWVVFFFNGHNLSPFWCLGLWRKNCFVLITGLILHALIWKGAGGLQYSNFFKLHYRITRKYASDHLAVSKPLEKFSVSTQRHEYMFVIYVSDSRMTYPHPLKKKIKSKRNLSSILLQKKKNDIWCQSSLCPSTIFK